MQANSIDEVIQFLDQIIETAIETEDRLGFFAALYRQVTLEVKRGIAEGFFEDGERMNRLDTVFANRYLAAYSEWARGCKPTRSWTIAFKASQDGELTILQQLLLGINAHINLDLGLAAAAVSPGDQLPSLKEDFNRINQILSRLLDRVQRVLDQFSPLMDLLDRMGGPADEAMLNFSIDVAREDAWLTAEIANCQSPERYDVLVNTLDRRVADLGERIAHPRPPLSLAVRLMRLQESNDIPTIIRVLNTLV